MSTAISQIVDCESVARDLMRQPELLAQVFDEPAAEPVAKAPAVQRYTGARSTLDEQRNLKIGALRLLGASDREIARACGCTTRTIPVVLRDLEKAGRLTALKERLAMAVGDNAERTQLVLRRLLDRALDGESDMDLAAMIKSAATAAGILTEKVLLLTGNATEIVDVRVRAGRSEIEEFAREFAVPIEAQVVVDRRANESESIADHRNTPEMLPNGAPRHVADTAAAADWAPGLAVAAGQTAAAEAQEGAGGGREILPGEFPPMGS